MSSLQHDSVSSELHQDSVNPEAIAELTAELEAPLPDLPEKEARAAQRQDPFDRAQLNRDSAQGTWASPKAGKPQTAGATGTSGALLHGGWGRLTAGGSAAARENCADGAKWDDVPQDVQRIVLQMTMQWAPAAAPERTVSSSYIVTAALFSISSPICARLQHRCHSAPSQEAWQRSGTSGDCEDTHSTARPHLN